ncbi:MAG: metallophosphoesterase [Synechococcales bacterium]|nr:metallophosphoesterase [Synechococcales bacterium]
MGKRWRRLVMLFIVGLVVVGAIAACTQSSPPISSPSVPPAPNGVTVEEESSGTPDQPTEAASRTALPPKTQAIVDSVGGEGLFNPPAGDVRLMVISDLNGPYGSVTYDPEVEKAMGLIPFWQPDMVVCSGDMVAGQDLTLTEQVMRDMWAGFDQYVATPLRDMKIPYGFTVGNHDASSAQGVGGSFLFQKERDITKEYWEASDHDPGIQFVDRYEFPFYYTFEQAGIFFLAWDGSSDLIPEDKLAWVEKALASPAAQQAKMRVLLGHLPLYSVAIGRNQPGEVMRDPQRLQDLLERYNVHTYISGHHHAYYPAHKGDLQLLHTGILGSGPRPLIDSDLPPWKALTIVDVNFDTPELTTYTTYNMETLELIENEQLPRFLVGHNGVVLRRDVEWEALEAGEKALCEQRLSKAQCSA